MTHPYPAPPTGVTIYPRVLVCGGRGYWNDDHVYSVLDGISGLRLIICGAANGADILALRWARLNGVEFRGYPAMWKKDGRAAGPLRNQRMLDDARPDLVVAFPGGKGTASMINLAKRAGVLVHNEETVT